jgi:hypothetical protein
MPYIPVTSKMCLGLSHWLAFLFHALYCITYSIYQSPCMPLVGMPCRNFYTVYCIPYKYQSRTPCKCVWDCPRLWPLWVPYKYTNHELLANAFGTVHGSGFYIPWSQGFSPAPYNESRLSLQWNWYVRCICVRYFCEWYSYTLVNMRVSVPTSAPLSKKNRYQGTNGTVSVIQYSVSPCTGRPGIFHII